MAQRIRYDGKQYDEELLFEPRNSIGITAAWLTELRQEIRPDPVFGH